MSKSKLLIHIYGAFGSGTSTLGRYLAEKFGFAFLDSDDYFWLPTNPKFTAKRSIEQRVPLMRRYMRPSSGVFAMGTGYDDGCPETRSAALHGAGQKRLSCPILVADGTAPLAENAARMEELLCSAN